uniref:Lipase-like C-terminal domain-containing protein n=1 Tax=Aplanochytrium stocchinoi TaxID=215587 RepID=A0A7S3PQM7_9STRA|mmetsp:Transcript_13429/g.16697  ORF Transcript_13429/g.16697 Transcript_13429/m.16697 type:complete len:446 (-) Transcript_13429:349-1686(-)
MESNISGSALPLVLVCGFLGPSNEAWGNKYWGEALTLGMENSPVFVAPVSCMASAYDRACEVFAFLKGKRVDFGETHAKEYGHARYGLNYSGKGKHDQWSEANPVHLIGHSFGGNTVRVLAYLLSVDHFKCGTNVKWIRSITTISSPLQGSLITYVLGACEDHEQEKPVHRFSPGYLLGVGAHCFELLGGKLGLNRYVDLGLGHWNLQKQGIRGWIHALTGGHNGGGTPAVCNRDNAANDMTIAAAKRWNDLIKEKVDSTKLYEFHLVASKSVSRFSIAKSFQKHFYFGREEQQTERIVGNQNLNPFYWPAILCARDFFTYYGARMASSNSFETLKEKICPVKNGLDLRLECGSDGLCSTYSQFVSNPNDGSTSPLKDDHMILMKDLRNKIFTYGQHTIKLSETSHFSIVPFPDSMKCQRDFFVDLFFMLRNLGANLSPNPNAPE